jgi:hypothetical protein
MQRGGRTISCPSSSLRWPTPSQEVRREAYSIHMPEPARLAAALADRYRIERELGAGGMATVYLAEDLKHDRKVAIKVLKPELAAVLGADRFVVEIKTTAALSHPHILPLFDSGSADGFLYYVMPFIKGETIREKLNRETQFGVDEAVRIAREVADALDYAHRNGVIHRDIKPENILLHDGRAMVMDFGIALAVSAAAGGRMTETGLSLGTPHYMSPEQATADKEISGRSDIYSLASVLFEMLAGQPPHIGGSAQQIIMKIIAEPVQPVTALRKSVPLNVSMALGKALEKLPADRFESAKTFSDALGNPGFTSTSGAGARVSAVAGKHGVPLWAFAGAILLAVGAVAVAAWKPGQPAQSSAPMVRFTLELPDSQNIVATIGQRPIAIAPDGSEILYFGFSNGAPVVYRRFLNELAVSQVPGVARPVALAFDPAGGDFAVQEEGNRITRRSRAGGTPTTIAENGTRPSWSDDVLAFARGGSIWRVSSSGGPPEQVTASDSGQGGGHSWPHMLPGGTALLYNYFREALAPSSFEVGVVRLSDGVEQKLGLRGSDPRYVSTGHILAAQPDGSVLAQPFDLKTLQLSGVPIKVLDGVLVKPGGGALYDVSRNGVLVYVEGNAWVRPVITNNAGREIPLDLPGGEYSHPRWSPSGDRVVLDRLEGGRSDIWIVGRNPGQAIRLTRDGRSNSPAWSPDGKRIGWIFSDSAAGARIVWQNADGSGSPQPIALRGYAPFFFQFTPDGKSIVAVVGSSFRHDIVLLPIDSTIAPTVLANAPADELQATVSPDGRWVAYSTSETGRGEVYVTSVTDPSTKVQITTDGGAEPAWLDNTTLMARRSGEFVRITLSLVSGIEVKRRETMHADLYRRGAPDRAYDVLPRTGEVVALARVNTSRDRIVVVTGWLEQLRQRMAQAVQP